ncbi:MAG: Rieske 2Fe-2S domain-containing protein [Candidatus Andersenbacteria bacterium]
MSDEQIVFKNAMGDVVAPDQVAEGGAVVGSLGESRVVVARVGGKLLAVSATCTHAGCNVGVNAAEHTLGCPCHGSRYTLGGKNIEGPAVRPLAPISVQESEGQIVLAA